jgi:glycosyltransferase involved in cell wall biosynthesis
VTLPTVSVVICTRNRPAALTRCIEAVCAQTVQPIEIIVVDDGRLPLDLRKDMAQRARDNGVFWNYISKTEPGLTRSRNLALASAQGEIVQFFDDDVEPAYHFLEVITGLFSVDLRKEVAVVAGTLAEPNLDTFGGQVWQAASAVAGWWALGGRRMRRGAWPDRIRSEGRVIPTLKIAGAALAVRRSTVYPPGFDEHLTGYALGEDREVGYRLSRRYLVGRATQALAIHHVDPASRPDPGAFGYATTYNYCYILSKNLPMGLGEYVAVLWSFIVIALARLASLFAGDREHRLAELAGMARGAKAWGCQRLEQSGFCW